MNNIKILLILFLTILSWSKPVFYSSLFGQNDTLCLSNILIDTTKQNIIIYDTAHVKTTVNDYDTNWVFVDAFDTLMIHDTIFVLDTIRHRRK